MCGPPCGLASEGYTWSQDGEELRRSLLTLSAPLQWCGALSALGSLGLWWHIGFLEVEVFGRPCISQVLKGDLIRISVVIYTI